jgi:hypothetical protein
MGCRAKAIPLAETCCVRIGDDKWSRLVRIVRVCVAIDIESSRHLPKLSKRKARAQSWQDARCLVV